MQVVETSAHIDKFGNIKLEAPLELRNQDVRIIILLPNGDELPEDLWLTVTAQNPAFDFLEAAEEDIYSPEDGQPLAR